jgi:hypothetical protein
MKTDTTPSVDWKAFFKQARGWVFQAAPRRPGNEDEPSLGSMETIYQVFKARMEAEREQT